MLSYSHPQAGGEGAHPAPVRPVLSTTNDKGVPQVPTLLGLKSGSLLLCCEDLEGPEMSTSQDVHPCAP